MIKMKTSEFTELIKNSLMKLLSEDDDVQKALYECVKGEMVINENVNKEPAEPDLYDQLALVASGKKTSFNYNGKTIKSPNHGVGYKGKKMIVEWTNKQYTKMGGEWKHGGKENNVSILKNLGGALFDESEPESHVDEGVLREDIKRKLGYNTVIKGNDGEVDMTDLLTDTFKTTYQKFPKSHETTSPMSAPASSHAAIVQEHTPEELFGDDSSNRWAHIAFSGIEK